VLLTLGFRIDGLNSITHARALFGCASCACTISPVRRTGLSVADHLAAVYAAASLAPFHLLPTAT